MSDTWSLYTSQYTSLRAGRQAARHELDKAQGRFLDSVRFRTAPAHSARNDGVAGWASLDRLGTGCST